MPKVVGRIQAQLEAVLSVLAPGVRAHGHPPTPPTHQTQAQSPQLPRLPPGPGLSAEGWGAKPRGGSGEGERAEEKRVGGAVSEPPQAPGPLLTEALL